MKAVRIALLVGLAAFLPAPCLAQVAPQSLTFGNPRDGVQGFTSITGDSHGGAWISGDIVVHLDAAGALSVPLSARIDGTRVRPLVQELANGDLLVAAHLPLVRDTNWNFYRGPLAIARMAPDGTLRWTRVLDARRAPLDVAETSDGSLLVVEPDNGGVIHRFTADGTRIDSRTYPLGTWATSSPSRMDLVPVDDGAVVLLSASSFPTAARIESNGRVAWSIRLPDVDPYEWSPGGVASGAPGDVVAVWTSEDAPYGTFVMRLDRSGRPVDQRMVQIWGNARPERLSSGDITLSGWEVARLAPDLSVRWGARLPIGQEGLTLADGTILLATGVDWDDNRGNGEGDPWLIVRGPRGEAPSGCPPSVPTVPPSQRISLVTASYVPSQLARVVTIVNSSATFEIAPEPLELYTTCDSRGCNADALDRDECQGLPSLVPKGPFALNFCSDPVDHLLLPACAGVDQIVTTSNLGPQADTVLELWTEDCATLLASDDDGGGGGASRIVFNPPVDTTVAVIVRQKDGSIGPGRDYTLKVDAFECGEATWSREFEVDGETLDVTSAAGIGSGWVVTGLLDDSSASAVFRIEADGSVPWCRKLDLAAGSVGVITVDGLPDGSALLGGFQNGSGLNDGLSWAGRVTSAGDLAQQWAVDETAGDSTLNWQGVVPRAGGMLLQAELWTGSAGDQVNTLVSVDDSGAIRWSCPLGDTRLQWAPMSDGGAIAWEQWERWIARIAPDGSVAWQEELSSDDGNTLARLTVYSCRESDAGSILVGVSGGGSLTVQPYLGFVTLAPDGSLLEERRIGFDAPDARDMPPYARAWPQPDGSFIAALANGSESYLEGIAIIGPDLEVQSARLSVSERYNRGDYASTSGILCFETWSMGWSQRVFTLRPSGRRAPACDPSVPASWHDMPPGTTITPSTRNLKTGNVVRATPSVISTPATLTWTEGCGSAPCLPPVPTIDSVTPSAPCGGSRVRLAGSGTGRGAMILEWDIDYDGTTFDVDATGPGVWVEMRRTGPITIALRATDECPFSGPGIVTQVVNVSDTPVPAIVGPSIHCVGAPCETLTLPAPWTSTSWPTGSLCVSPTATTTYSIVATDPATGCSWNVTHEVEVAATPLAVTVRETCPGGAPTLEAIATGGVPPHEWSWSDGQTSPVVTVAPGVYTVTVTDALGCTKQATWTTTVECGPPGEVSGPGAQPLLVTGKTTNTLSFEKLAAATSYNILTAPIGQWLSPTSNTCHRTSWTDAGTRLTGTRNLAVNTWLLITASNDAGEGPAGASTFGERSASVSWTGCP